MIQGSTKDTSGTGGRFTGLDHFFVSCLWLAYSVQWAALLAIVLPSQVAAIVGPLHKEFYNGLIGALGATVALVVTPIAGALSDRSRNPSGRRRSYLISGVLMSLAFLAGLAGFGKGSSFWAFALCLMGLQFACNWWGGPYAGLIPDVVPAAQRGRASGFMAVMQGSGTIIGALSAGVLARNGVYWPVYTLIIIALLVMLSLTLWRVHEHPMRQPRPPFELPGFLRSFVLDPKRYRDFYWVMITRGFVTMGVYSVFTFFQYFLADVIHVKNPIEQSSYLIGVITAMSIPTSFVAGSLSDRYGRKLLVYISGGLMAAAMVVYIAVAFLPTLTLTFIVAGVFGMGYGAYQAVDWALALDVLPGGDDSAKDMGIWHVSMVLPQIFAPAITGTVLNTMKSTSLLLGYTVVFILTAVWFILGTVFVRQIRGVR